MLWHRRNCPVNRRCERSEATTRVSTVTKRLDLDEKITIIFLTQKTTKQRLYKSHYRPG